MPPTDPLLSSAGLTVREVAKRYRISPDKVRNWIRSGELAAVNTSANLCGRPRWIILPEQLEAFTRRRQVVTPPKPKRRRKQTGIVDYYPD